ncbi:ubiquitin-conjugating enzyme E2 H-like [Tribolium castaneum]|uniref:Ubiquitin-conjugating enzyme E2 H n=1 Tax=Tribolium castaneum TaxID=7070 RepID=D6WSA6_TRICA|nr:Ubiquitin-conjugating enzyme E2 C-like Protein [Tribolium castaneum]
MNHRIKIDVMRLIESKFDVTTCDNYRNLIVKFNGPRGTPYEGGVWRVRVLLPENYPFKSPSVGFDTQIFHPNVDQTSGTICLDVLNQKWTALYDLVIIFETFLPQLLKNPNPEDPLNHCAAMVLTRTPERYNYLVVKHVQEFATPERMRVWEEGGQAEEQKEDGVSDLSDDEEDN